MRILFALTLASSLLTHPAWAQDSSDSGGGDSGSSYDSSSDSSSFDSTAPADTSSGAAAGYTGDAAIDASATAENETNRPAPTEPPFVVIAPPLGVASGRIKDKTRASVMATYGVTDEGTSGDRYWLLKNIKAAAPEKITAMGTLINSTTAVRSHVNGFITKLTNVTTLLNADASAGGLVASARSLMQEVPATQKLVATTMMKQMKNMQGDAFLVKKSVQGAEDQFRQRIQALAETVGLMIARQDREFSKLAGSQARAMNKSAIIYEAKSKAALSDAVDEIESTSRKAQKTNRGIEEGVSQAIMAVNSIKESVRDVKSEYTASLTKRSRDIEGTLNEASDKALDKIEKKAVQAGITTDKYAMQAATALERGLSQLDGQSAGLVRGVVADAASGARTLDRAADKSQNDAEKGIHKAASAVESNLGRIVAKSDSVTSDGMTIARDLQAFLQSQSTASAGVGSGTAAEMARLQAAMQSMLGSAAGKAQALTADVVGGTTGESARLAQVISMVLQQATGQASNVAGRSGDALSATEKQQADELARRNGAISSAQDTLAAKLGDSGRAALRGAGEINGRLSDMASMFGGSIGDLVASLGDSSSSGSRDLTQLQGSLSGRASDAFAGLLENLRGINKEGSESAQDFFSRIAGPAKDGAAKQFEQLQAMLTAIAASGDSQSGQQEAALEALRSLQSQFGGKLDQLKQSMKGVTGLNSELTGSVSADGTRMLNDYRTSLTQALQEQMNAAKGDTGAALNAIDKILRSLVGGNAANTQDAIAQVFAKTGAGLDNGARDFSTAQKDQLKSLSGLNAMAISLLGDTTNQGLQDKATTESMMASAKANIVAKFKEIAASTTDTQIGRAMQDLAKAGNDTDIINYLLSDVGSALKKIDSDAALARDVNDKKRAEFANYVSKSEGDLKKSQAEIIAQLESTIQQVDTELNDKTALIGASEKEMKSSLDEIRGKVEKAQETLRKNLVIYQEKLDGIIGQIRSYMNLSANADELAISQDIARQLAQINATDVAIASANSVVSSKLASKKAAQGKTGQATYDVVDDVIGGAMETENSVADSHMANTDQLVAVAAGVDAAAMDLEGNIKGSTESMETGIASSSAVAKKAMKAAEGQQAKNVDQVNVKSSDVASQARKSFIKNLEKMGGVHDDTLMVSKQLGSLLSNADGTITDISQSAISHLDRSVATMVRLNKQEAKKVASVSDVMNSFQHVVLGFINETTQSMDTVMNQLNTVGAASKKKLKQLDTRSKDELNWVNNGINTTRDGYSQVTGQERTIQSALKQGVLDSESRLMASKSEKESEIGDIDDAIASLRQEVAQGQTRQTNKVRDWISSRGRSGSRLLMDSAPSSFVESKSREAIVKDIRRKMKFVRKDIDLLRSH